MKKLLLNVLVFFATVYLIALPVSADLVNGYYRVAPNVTQGATVFIGEQGLDVTSALNSANAAGTPSAFTTIGWWASAADLYNTAPTVSLDLNGRAAYFTVTQFEFDTYEGQWYLLDPANNNVAKTGAGAVFNVKSPKLDITVRNPDQYDGADVSGQSVPIGTRLQFQIGTNMYTVLNPTYRTPVYDTAGSDPNTDGYLDIVVRDQNGAYHLTLPGDVPGVSNTLLALNVSTQPYTWGRTNRGLGPGINYVWNTSTYPAGTYTVSVQSKLNNMYENYRSGSAAYTGRTVSETKTITLAGSTTPVLGSRIGVYQNGAWYLDNDGSGTWTAGDKAFNFGAPGWTPILGDWSLPGFTFIGVTNGQQWYLDWNGNGIWDNGVDKAYNFGAPGWKPVVSDWNNDGKTEIGVTDGQKWYLDWNGNGAWDAGTDKTYSFGAPGWTPVVGKWTSIGFLPTRVPTTVMTTVTTPVPTTVMTTLYQARI